MSDQLMTETMRLTIYNINAKAIIEFTSVKDADMTKNDKNVLIFNGGRLVGGTLKAIKQGKAAIAVELNNDSVAYLYDSSEILAAAQYEDLSISLTLKLGKK